MKSGTKKTTKSKSSNLNGASNRFKSITERAKQIREKHPNMKWKNAIKQASSELFQFVKFERLKVYKVLIINKN